MKENAEWGDRKTQLGLGVLHWELHLKAIRIHWLAQRYMDGKRGPWKTLLDNWFARSEIGRGALFDARTADCTRAISSSIMNNKSQIASFHT